MHQEGASKPSGNQEACGSQEGGGAQETEICHECEQRGYLACNCTKRNSSVVVETESQGERTQEKRSAKKRYNCKQSGHIAHYCPSPLHCGDVIGIRKCRGSGFGWKRVVTGADEWM